MFSVNFTIFHFYFIFSSFWNDTPHTHANPHPHTHTHTHTFIHTHNPPIPFYSFIHQIMARRFCLQLKREQNDLLVIYGNSQNEMRKFNI